MSKILLMDDSPVIRLQIAYICKSLNCSLIEAVDAKQGVALLSEETDIAAIFIDLQMPNGNAVDLAVQLIDDSKWHSTQVILLYLASHKHLLAQIPSRSNVKALMKPFLSSDLELFLKPLISGLSSS